MPTKAKKGDKLTPIPKPKKVAGVSAATARQDRGGGGDVKAPEAGPDLSHIAPGLRPLAVPIESVDFYPGNPHKHDEAQISAIRAALREHGQVHPLLLNTAKSPSHVVAGNGRLQAALAEGWTHIAAHGRDMSDQEAAALVILDNRLQELSPGWDEQALKAAIETAQVAEQDLAAVLTALAEAEGLIPKEGADVAKPSPAEPTAPVEKRVTCPACQHEFALESPQAD